MNTFAIFFALACLMCYASAARTRLRDLSSDLSLYNEIKVQQLEDRMNELDADALKVLLKRFKSEEEEKKEVVKEEEEEEENVVHHKQVNVAHQCNTVIMQSMVPKDLSIDNGVSFDYYETHTEPIASSASSFLEKSEETLTTMEGGEIEKQLKCQCDEYACHCRKQCFCKLTDTNYGGDIIMKGGDKADDVPRVPDHQFKCSCSFDGAGGNGFSNGGTMDCDCKVADCTCEKKCACKAA